MRRKLSLFLLLAFLSVPIFARVLSYAPYTDRVARSGYHLRETRYFPIIEGDWTEDLAQRVVLHDSSGKEEPRVLHPLNTTAAQHTVDFAAWHEGTSVATSRVLIMGYDPDVNNNIARYSRDGGATWTRLSALDSHYFYDRYVDRGGPFVRGMSGAVRIGNAATPFVALFTNGKLYAIDDVGEVRLLLSGVHGIVGQNRAGTKFLVRTYAEIETVDLAGHRKHVRVDTGNQRATGWISDDGSVYLLDQGRLDRYTASGAQLVARYEYNMHQAWRFLAVPTSDFSGAWLAQVGPGNPTSLWRFTPELGLMMMWSDVSGPEIEALIAGASGNSVLIQVHRDRSVALQRPFIDPALAVWRVGQDAPREYDELYLNEEENKGFIHIDVEKVADGTPFVFDSGAFEGGFEEGPVSPPAGGGGDVIQEWGIVRGSLKQRLILPGVARLRGAFDSEWLTDVTLYNPSSASQRVEIRYVPMGETATASMLSHHSLTVTLQPHEVSFVPDALHALFGVESGGGALHFLPTSGINVFGRTYSRKGAGTFGFGMQAIDALNAAGAGFPLTFAGAFPGKNFRTNILLTDTSGRGTAASLGAYGVSGAYGGSVAPSIHAPAGGTLQFNAIGPSLSLQDTDAGGLKLQPTRGTGIATVVSIDNRTNDPTYFPPDLSATIARVIPVIGHLAGANNSRFRSDLYLFNPSRQTRTVQLEAKQWDGPAWVIKRFTLLPNEARVVPDALLTLFGMTGLARVQYATLDPGEGVRVTSRTYTLEESGATYGSLVPPLNNFQIGTAGDAMEILGAVHSDGFRTNIGLVELSPSQSLAPNVNVRIRIIDASRTKEETFTVTVPRAGGMQINDIFRARNFNVEGGALIVVEVLTDGLIGAYATLTDNTTNDTTYLASHLGAKP